MATLLLAIELGIPIDRVMYCDIRFSDDISGEHPIMAKWIPEAEHILKNRFGIVVDHAYSGITFVEQFYKVKQKGNRAGQINGFPFTIGAWCNSRLKITAISKYLSQFKNTPITQFVGIAYDEPLRWQRFEKKTTELIKYRSLLFEQKLIENDTFDICKKYNLLFPIYGFDGIYRGGCWFCPKQPLADLYSLWDRYPGLYHYLELLESDSFNSFKPNLSLTDLSSRFGSGYIPQRKKINLVKV